MQKLILTDTLSGNDKKYNAISKKLEEQGRACTYKEIKPYCIANLVQGIKSGDADCAGWAAESLATIKYYRKTQHAKYFRFQDEGDGVWPVTLDSAKILNAIKDILNRNDASCTAGSEIYQYADNHLSGYLSDKLQAALEKRFEDGMANDQLYFRDTSTKATSKDVFNLCKKIINDNIK